jgi:hypothetical protein
MLQTDGADEEFVRELLAIGYQAEEARSVIGQKEAMCMGMLRLGCRRAVQPVPLSVPSLSPLLRVRAVSAGYAHCMLLTETGHLYGAGYNDRYCMIVLLYDCTIV